ncbi:hypothetical protein GF376_04530 [Candidatus Peregrinibacteria bacterium]|nr:hypothetical protein [Candidatus Peregrinibacteria bacterium]
MGKKFWFTKKLAGILNISRFQAYKESLIIKGALLAIILHTFYNYLLAALNLVIPAAIVVTLSFLYLKILLKNRAGQLILTTDENKNSISTMAKKDEEVVIELLGLWFKQKKYVDVIHICNRLLKRDPDNKVVKLFKAKALDQTNPNSPYSKILSSLFSSQDESIINKKEQ